MKPKLRYLFALLLYWPMAPLLADAGGFVTGIEYQEIFPAQHTSAPPGKIEVVEVFWYGCPHCYNTEPHVKKWLKNKPDVVHFVRMPSPRYSDNKVGQQNLWKFHARAYYTAEALGLADKMHDAFFKEFHQKGNRLDTEDKLAALFLKFGVSRETFLNIFNKSARIRNQVANARGMIQRYRASSVPTFIINGKYRTTSTMAGSTEAIFEVINALVKQEAERLGLQAQ